MDKTIAEEEEEAGTFTESRQDESTNTVVDEEDSTLTVSPMQQQLRILVESSNAYSVKCIPTRRATATK